jgi:branched-chain amino acid transport system ATP-binding protein
VLEVNNIHTYYGNIQALKGVSISVKEGEICTLIGSNGAGKTTLLRTIQGLLKPREGRIFFNQKPIESLAAEQIVKLGISQSPEGRLIFPKMTVLENLEMGAFSRRDRSKIKSDIDKILALFPRLKERIAQKAGTMSGGEQQMLAMGRALMARPKLLLLDEPSMGLAPILVNQIFDIIQDINREGTTILLVEQNARKALKIAQTGYILQTGKVVKSDSAIELQFDPEVRRIYLGEE